MCLSPDHRYLYVNSRPWEKESEKENPIHLPALAHEIEIHIIDLVNLKELGKMQSSQKALMPGKSYIEIDLDVSQEYVASGAEDKHGYLWDRHYGICINKFPHSDIVNSVAFNPADPEMLVTVSDDCSIKVWRSLNREKKLKNTATRAAREAADTPTV
ncbi:hypothetical protein CHS0354_017530 [Potamilus streckersoni]|uniref:Uncharacterized protein n=1 Tax=Potamilus streckersoni TaxID=2493646 RepID=A0AAE0S7E1_9BIVA|nr:hypothetical protein CHS0354_017530 [Potamilus streckersoni]